MIKDKKKELQTGFWLYYVGGGLHKHHLGIITCSFSYLVLHAFSGNAETRI